MKETRQLNRWQVRWAEFMTQLDFKIIYRPGTAGGKPDTLSRLPEYRLKDGDTPQEIQAMIHSGQVDMTGRTSESIVISTVKETMMTTE